MNKSERIIRNLMLAALFVLFVYVTIEIVHIDLEDLRYTTEYYEDTSKVRVKEILREKGKETQYVIEIIEGETTIPESVFNEYIGEGNNVITITKATTSIYIGQPFPFGCETSFDGRLKMLYRQRFAYPWQENVQPYTEEEVKMLAKQYLNDEIEPNGSAGALPDDAKAFVEEE